MPHPVDTSRSLLLPLGSDPALSRRFKVVEASIPGNLRFGLLLEVLDKLAEEGGIGVTITRVPARCRFRSMAGGQRPIFQVARRDEEREARRRVRERRHHRLERDPGAVRHEIARLDGERDVAPSLRAIRDLFRGERFDLTDGVKVLWPDRWFLARASTNEPVLRLAAEAPTEPEARALVNRVLELLSPGA